MNVLSSPEGQEGATHERKARSFSFPLSAPGYWSWRGKPLLTAAVHGLLVLSLTGCVYTYPRQQVYRQPRVFVQHKPPMVNKTAVTRKAVKDAPGVPVECGGPEQTDLSMGEKQRLFHDFDNWRMKNHATAVAGVSSATSVAGRRGAACARAS